MKFHPKHLWLLTFLAASSFGVLAQEAAPTTAEPAAEAPVPPSPFAASRNCLMLVHMGSKDMPASMQISTLLNTLERDLVLTSRLGQAAGLPPRELAASFDAVLPALREVAADISEITLDLSMGEGLPLAAFQMGMGLRLTLATTDPAKARQTLEPLVARATGATPGEFMANFRRLKWTEEPGKLVITHNPFALKGSLMEQAHFRRAWESQGSPADPSLFAYVNLERVIAEVLPLVDGMAASSGFSLRGSGVDELKSLSVCTEGSPAQSRSSVLLSTEGRMQGHLAAWLEGDAPAGKLQEMLLPGLKGALVFNLPWKLLSGHLMALSPEASKPGPGGFTLGELLALCDGRMALQCAGEPWITVGLSSRVSADIALERVLAHPKVAATTREVSGRKVHALRFRSIPHPFYLTLVEDGDQWHLGINPAGGLDMAGKLSSAKPAWPYTPSTPLVAGHFSTDMDWIESLIPFIEAGRTALDPRKAADDSKRLALAMPAVLGRVNVQFSSHLDDKGFWIQSKGGQAPSTRTLSGDEFDILMTSFFRAIVDLAPAFLEAAPSLREMLQSTALDPLIEPTFQTHEMDPDEPGDDEHEDSPPPK